MKEIISEILQTNPGIVTTLVTAFCFPVILVLITNRQSRKQKEMEQRFEVEKEKLKKQLELGIDPDNAKKVQENTVYSSLIKILFEVQKLHIELSGNCVDYKCLEKAVESFKAKFSQYQEIISENQLYLKPKVTNDLYDYYQTLGNLLIEIKEIEADKKYELANVAVYFHAQQLASIILRIQDGLSELRSDLNYQIKNEELMNFVNCCGRPPRKEDVEKYKEMNPLNKGIIQMVNAQIAASSQVVENEVAQKSK